MKAVFIFSLVVAVVAAGNWNKNDRNYRNVNDRDAKRQRFVIDLLHHLQQDLHHEAFMQYSNTIRLDYKNEYKDLNKVYHMVSLFQNGWFEERNKPFSLFRERNIVTTKAMFDFFDTMSSWNTVAMNLIWARRNINEYQFWHLMTLLVTHNRHFNNLVLPAYYEVFPNQFFTADVMDQATNLRLTSHSDFNDKHVIKSNYTSGVLGSNDNDDNHNVYDLNDIKNSNNKINDWNTLKKVMNDIKNQLYINKYNNNSKKKDMKNKVFNNNRNLNQGNKFDNNGEDRMVYFTEDIGLNNYYYFSRMGNSRIVNNKQMYSNLNNKDNYNMINGKSFNNFENNDKINRRGERYLYQMNQLLARYNLERKANGLDNVQTISLEGTVDNGVFPNLRYTNGLQMPNRQNEFNLKKQHNMRLVQVTNDFENRFWRAIDQGFVLNENGHKVNLQNKDGFNILGNLLQGNRDSVNTQYYRYLEHYYRLLFGGNNNDNVDFTDNRFVPTVLDHYETSMRDSVFWQIIKRINNIADKYKSKLTGYKTKHVNFDGVKINNVKVDKMETTFNDFDTDITNGINMNFKGNGNDHNSENNDKSGEKNSKDSNSSNDSNESRHGNSNENKDDDNFVRMSGKNNDNQKNNMNNKNGRNTNRHTGNSNNDSSNSDSNESNNSNDSNVSQNSNSNEINHNGNGKNSNHNANYNRNNVNRNNNHGRHHNFRNGNSNNKNYNGSNNEHHTTQRGTSQQVNYYKRHDGKDNNNDIFARTRRMDTKQFTVTIDVQSNKKQNGIVRIFLGTRINNKQQLNDNLKSFVELDQFIVRLNQGQNLIKRNSYDFKNVVGDPQTMNTIYYRALNFLNKETDGNDVKNFNYDTNNNNQGFPHRLVLPKGTVGGQEYTLFVIVNDLENDNDNVQFNDNMGTRGTHFNGNKVNNGDSNESNNINDSNDFSDPKSSNSNESNSHEKNNGDNKNNQNGNNNLNDYNNFRYGNNFNKNNDNNDSNKGQDYGNGNWGTTNGVKIHNYNNGNMNVGNGNGVLDNRAMGFPLDRQIIDVTGFISNNMYFKDVKIYHVDNNQNNFNNYKN